MPDSFNRAFAPATIFPKLFLRTSDERFKFILVPGYPRLPNPSSLNPSLYVIPIHTTEITKRFRYIASGARIPKIVRPFCIVNAKTRVNATL